MIKIPVSIGEVWDKLSILQIKKENISDESSLAAIRHEINEIEAVMDIPPDRVYEDADFKEMVRINKLIWDGIAITQKWLDSPIGEDRYETEARVVIYNKLNIDNNDRFRLKRKINNKFKSEIKEVKSHL